MADEKLKSSLRVHLIVFSSYLYAFTNDATLSWSSPVLPKLLSNSTHINPLGRSIQEHEASWLGSLLSLGNMVGLLPYGYLCFKFGRKYVLISLGLLHALSFLLFTTKSLICFYVGRFLNGVASGAGFVIFPVYIAEICRDSDRGSLLVSRHIFSSCGFLFSHIAGNYLSIFWFNIVLCIFPLLFVISFTYLAIESPFFYAMKDDLIETRKIVVELTGEDTQQTDEDVDEIRRAIEMTQMRNLNETLAHRPIQKAMLLVYVLFIFQHLTGYMPFATYTEVIIKDIPGIDFKNSGMIIGIIFLIGSSISTSLIDIKGRKWLIYISLIAIIVIEIIFASFYFFLDSLIYLPVICLACFFLFFNLCLTFLPQIICAEILPLSIKFKVACSAGVLGYATAFLLTTFFLDVNTLLGTGWTIIFFAFCSCIHLVIITIFLPETKGRSYRQIQYLLEVGMEMEVMS